MRIIPRVAGVSGSSTLWLIRRRPMPSTVFAWVLLNPIVLLRSVTVRRLADLPLAAFFGHHAPTNSANSLPRMRATKAGSFKPMRPAKVARTTLCGLAEPSDFVSTF